MVTKRSLVGCTFRLWWLISGFRGEFPQIPFNLEPGTLRSEFAGLCVSYCYMSGAIT